MKALAQYRSAAGRNGKRAWSGFSLLEMTIVMTIAIIMTVIALPLINGALSTYKLNSAVTSVTGAINTTRYRALQNGIQFELTLTNSPSNYQVLQDTSGNNSGTFTNVGNPIQFSSTANLLGTSTTLVFHPGGSVQCPACSAGQVDAAGNISLTITYSNLPTETITVSPYGRINVTP